MKNLRYIVGFFLAACGFLFFVFSSGSENFKTEAQETKDSFAKFAVGDEITKEIRGRDTEFHRVKINQSGDRAEVRKYGKIIEDYGTFVVISKNKNADLKNSKLESQPIETTIHLPNDKFDPIKNTPPNTIKPNGEASENFSSKDYFIVQFGSLATDDWLESLRGAGAEVLQYVPHQAFFVYADGATIQKIAAHSRVRWTGHYLPEQKLSPELRSFVSNVKGEKAMFDVAVFNRANLTEVRARLENLTSGKVLNELRLPNNFFNVLRVEIPLNDVEKIANIADVVRIDQYEKPQAEDERAAQIVAGNYTSPTVILPPGYNPLTQFGVDGTNVTVAVVDDGVSVTGNGGFYLTTNNTIDGPLRGAVAGASGGHGHINASIIAGNTPFGALDPLNYNYGIGVAPKANIINIPFLKSGNITTDLEAVDDTLNTIGPNGVKGSITNNSWGNGTNGNSYDSYAAQYDGYVQDASIAATFDPITIIFSAGNSGTSGLTRPKVSKNTISVANSENIRTEFSATGADNMDDLRSTSSRGIAADGRIKPDITAPGSFITGSRSGSCASVSSCFDANHAYSTGTSHAAPQVAGAAALFTQFWKNNNGGSNPSPSLIKASVINTGQEMNGSLTNTAIPNGNEGWGRIFLKNMFTTVPVKRINQTHEFSNPGETVVYTGTVADSTKPFRVSLVWTDPPGAADPALVNNLDLTVQVGANIYRGNVFSNGNSITGGSSSTIDNVENVFLPAGIAVGTQVTITVGATALNGNGILGNADATDQHFSLVAYNLSEQAAISRPPFDYDGDGKTDISIFRPAQGEWWYLRSSNGSNFAAQFGSATDKIVPADYTGDGKTDFAFFRPSSGQWFILRSEDFSFFAFPLGVGTDIPVPADYDGDGKADAAVFRESSLTWFINKSSGGTDIIGFGAAGDKPVVGDYDGDSKADIAIFRPNSAEWWIRRSSNGSVFALQFGNATDKPVQGDWTGDGKTDVAFWRPSNGNWFVLRSEDFSFFSFPFGANGDVPVAGDYDGDRKFDAGVFRPTNQTWFVNRSTAGTLIQNFGISGDIPTPNVFVP